jgi:putative oxidoreductase
MKAFSLFVLRASVALLVLLWGIDKLVDPEHAIRVSDTFYRGLLSHPGLVPVLGTAQIAVSLLALVGLFRRFVDPVILLINLGSMLGVWRSIVDPWGWVLDGTNVLFFPSLIVSAACVAIIAFHDQERLVLDRRRVEGGSPVSPSPQ